MAKKKRIPKYQMIANDIERQIAEGELVPGERLKTERELVVKYDVSKMTLRHAFDELIKKNVIINRYHQGYFVTNANIHRDKEIMGVTEMFARRGLEIKSEVVKLAKVFPDPEAKEMLQLKEGEWIYRLERIRRASHEVMLLEYANIVASKVPNLEMFNFEEFSLFDVYHKHYGIHVSWARDEISADWVAGKQAAILLDRKTGPALIVKNLSFDQSGTPLEYTTQIYNYKVFTYTVISNQTTPKYSSELED